MKEIKEKFLLKKKVIDSFNYEACKQKLIDLIDYYYIYNLEYHYINFPTITPSYEIKYDSNKDFTPSSKTERYVINKISNEEEVKEFYNDMYEALKNLTLEELKYFNLYYIYKRSENYIMYELNINERYFKILKKSCVIKMALFFHIAVRK